MKCIHFFTLILMSGIIIFSSCKKKKTEDPLPETVTINSAITADVTWTASKTYIIDGEVTVDNCTITIEPGTTIKFNTGASLWFGYYNNCTVIANGSADKHIKFTTSASSPAAGAWSGVYFSSHCLSNTSVTFCDFEYGGTADNGIVNIAGTKITFQNCSVKNAKNFGIDLSYDGSFVSFTDNTISNTASHAMSMKANAIHTLGTNNNITCGTNLGIFVIGNYVTNTSTGGLSSISWEKQPVAFFFAGETDVDNLTLTIKPGCYFKFDANASMWFGYYNNTTVIANGTSVDRITFTTSAANPAPGAWEGLHFHSHILSGTTMSFCSVQYGGGNGYDTDANLNIEYAPTGSFSISDCAINYSKGYGIIKAVYQTIPTSVTYTGNVLGNVKP